MPRKNRPLSAHATFTQNEYAEFEKNMEAALVSNRSEYLRNMALYGKTVTYDTTELREIARLMATISNNVNQVAHRANENRSIYAKDVETLHMSVADALEQVRKAMKIVARMNDDG
ncbi:MAG: plasmid mobilization relaxosome protein MobC [Defluviitaleaceae bacterium]|nr:plasmid mobilization relaxosome protein MobC [Defluviitaleaceae bacterium]